MTTRVDVDIPKRDWTTLRTKKLFWVPQIIDAYTSVGNAITMDELRAQSPKDGSASEKYSIAVVRDICNVVPVNAGKALAVVAGFNRLDDREATYIVGALFLSKRHKDLFSDTALSAHGVDVTAAGLGLKQPTLDNLLIGGRITAYVAKTFLEGVQKAYQTAFEGQDNLPEEVADFLACKDLKDYVTPNKEAGHREVLRDSNDAYLCASEDLLPAPDGWTAWD